MKISIICRDVTSNQSNDSRQEKKHWHYIPIYDCMLSKYKDNIKQCEQYYNTHIH